MIWPLDETHDPAAQSWVVEGNRWGHPFPLQNLPFCVFRRHGVDESFRIGVGIGDRILDLTRTEGVLAACGSGLTIPDSLLEGSLNALMREGPAAWSSVRQLCFQLLRLGGGYDALLGDCLVEQAAAEYRVPMEVGDYTDFYASIDHARNIGKLFRPDSPLMPNYEWVPIAYHGRASSIVISGELVRRPCGQVVLEGATQPSMMASRKLDYEMEMGLVVGGANALGQAIPMDQAEENLFGVCLLNDWSARDIQAWEYQPLGPFLGKSFATTVSPWIITMQALAPFRIPSSQQAKRPILPYLQAQDAEANRGIDVCLEVSVQSQKMADEGLPPKRIGLSNLKYAYWTPAQMVAHHTVNGCNLRAGDLLGSGTMSGPGLDKTGALIEVNEGGKTPVRLSDTETRRFLEDGDSVTISGWCEREGYRPIGLGECEGRISPAQE